MDKRASVLQLLHEARPEVDFCSSDNFISDGLLDSIDVITVTSMFEETFNIKIDPMDIVPMNYDSVEHMVALIEKSGSAE